MGGQRMISGRRLLAMLTSLALAGATLVSSSPASAHEGTSFEVDFDLRWIDGESMGAFVSCTRPSTISITMLLVQHQRYTIRAGGTESFECVDELAVIVDVEQEEFGFDQGRFIGGPASYFIGVSGLARSTRHIENFRGETRLAGAAFPEWPSPERTPGEHISVDIAGGTPGTAGVELLIECDSPATASADVLVRQLAGNALLRGSGRLRDVPCDGPSTISVPLGVRLGVLAGGEAYVEVALTSRQPDGQLARAEVSDVVHLRGTSNRPFREFDPIPPPNDKGANTHISIVGVREGQTLGSTSHSILIEVDCDGAGYLAVDGTMSQFSGRVGGLVFHDEDYNCTGGTMLLSHSLPRIEWGRFTNGQVYVSVTAAGFRERGTGYGEGLLWRERQRVRTTLKR